MFKSLQKSSQTIKCSVIKSNHITSTFIRQNSTSHSKSTNVDQPTASLKFYSYKNETTTEPRSINNLNDLDTLGLFEVINSIKAMRSKLNIHPPYPEKKFHPVEQQILSDLNVCFVFNKTIKDEFSINNSSMAKSLTLLGADVKITSIPELARLERTNLKKTKKSDSISEAEIIDEEGNVNQDTENVGDRKQNEEVEENRSGDIFKVDADGKPTSIGLAADFISKNLTQEHWETSIFNTTLQNKGKKAPFTSKPFDVIVLFSPGVKYQSYYTVLNECSKIPVVNAVSDFGSPVSAISLISSFYTVVPSMLLQKVGFIGDATSPVLYDLARASQMLQFNLSIATNKRLSPKKDIMNDILTKNYIAPFVDDTDCPGSILEVVEHPFISSATADFIVTNTLVEHVNHQGKPSHPLPPALIPYEVDREMLSVSKDTSRVAHVVNPIYLWNMPYLGLDDNRCLMETQMRESNYALPALLLWALSKKHNL